ncbi:MAG TPA: hypothetical protein VFK80_01795, partial [Limnochordia bacterium]|nr:hypothetical protein [Limnochordia bacterium]
MPPGKRKGLTPAQWTLIGAIVLVLAVAVYGALHLSNRHSASLTSRDPVPAQVLADLEQIPDAVWAGADPSSAKAPIFA